MSQITPDGIYPDMPAAAYHADPALGHSGAVTLMDVCPARFRWDRDHPADEIAKRELEFGRAAHLIILEPNNFAAATVMIPAADYKKGVARDLRDAARAAGTIPLLEAEIGELAAMAVAVRASRVIGDMLASGGQCELSLFWTDKKHGVRRKARFDYLDREQGIAIDLKTALSAHAGAIGKAAYRDHWWSQQEWYRDGYAALIGGTAPRMVFVSVEKAPPYLVAGYELRPSAAHWGRMFNDQALTLFAHCNATETWPGYGAGIRLLELPNFAEFQLQERFVDSHPLRRTEAPLRYDPEMGMVP